MRASTVTHLEELLSRLHEIAGHFTFSSSPTIPSGFDIFTGGMSSNHNYLLFSSSEFPGLSVFWYAGPHFSMLVRWYAGTLFSTTLFCPVRNSIVFVCSLLFTDYLFESSKLHSNSVLLLKRIVHFLIGA